MMTPLMMTVMMSNSGFNGARIDALLSGVADEEVMLPGVCEEDFVQKVIPALLDRHQNKRSVELVASASVLLRMAGIDDAAAARLAEAVMNRSQPCYRSAFALTKDFDSQWDVDYRRYNGQVWQRNR